MLLLSPCCWQTCQMLSQPRHLGLDVSAGVDAAFNVTLGQQVLNCLHIYAGQAAKEPQRGYQDGGGQH